MNKVITVIIFVIILSCTMCFNHSYAKGESLDEIEHAEDELPVPIRAKVIEVLSQERVENEYSGGNIEVNSQRIMVKILAGSHKGEEIKADHYLNSFNESYNILLHKGQEVFLFIEEDSGGKIKSAFVSEVARDRYLLYLLIAFILVMLIVGGFKGLKAVISLGLTILAIIYILLPMILRGYNPIIISVLVCIGVIIITMVMVGGFNNKTLSAIVGTAGGVIIAGGIALFVGQFTKLTGLGDEESQMLMYIPQNITFDFRGLLFSGIIIGAMGAAMDVGISIASSINEIALANPNMRKVDLFKAGMNVGRDVMGTMSNTLILAYAGGSMHLMLLLMAYNVTFVEIVNRELIASEILRALSGSIGLIVTIPLTAITASNLIRIKEKKDVSQNAN